ncbi:MAG: hypothetical protein ACPGWM_05490, partial [Flavobacteriales bacterium]
CLNTFAPYTYCYGDNESSSLTFQSDQDSGVTLNIESGTIETNWDLFTVYDGPQSDGEVLFSGDGDLSGMSFYAASGTLVFEIVSDGSVSCASGGMPELIYTVSCNGEELIGGCMDVEAINYNEEATYDDGSCEYEEECDGVSAHVTFTLGTFAAEVSWFITDSEGNFIAGGEGYESGQTYSLDLCLEDGCYTLHAMDSFGDGWNGGLMLIEIDGFTYTYTLENGVEGIYDFGVNTFECYTEIEGCTDDTALNYNPLATIDDGTCEYPNTCDEGILAQLYICTFSNGQNVSLSLLDSDGDEFASFNDLNNGQIMNTEICIPEGCLSAVRNNHFRVLGRRHKQ